VCAFDFKDGVGDVGVLDERLVGGVKEDEGVVLAVVPVGLFG